MTKCFKINGLGWECCRIKGLEDDDEKLDEDLSGIDNGSCGIVCIGTRARPARSGGPAPGGVRLAPSRTSPAHQSGPNPRARSIPDGGN